MKTQTKLEEAAQHAANALQAIRDSGAEHTSAVLADCLLDLAGQAAKLKRDVSRLTEMVGLDANE